MVRSAHTPFTSPSPPTVPVPLVAGILVTDPALFDTLRPELESRFSTIVRVTDWFAFPETHYYREGMGPNLHKRFVAFEEGILPGELVPVKRAAMAMEAAHRVGTRRRVNIDPGYLCESKLVLATVKDFAHRIYLGDGIFGDVHLIWSQGRFHPQPWTYPDYHRPDVLTFFAAVRSAYRSRRGAGL